MFENLEEVKKLKFRNASFVADSLREHRETAFLSRQLTGIACDMPLPVSRVTELRRLAPDLATVDTFCEAQGLGRMLREQARRIHARHPG